MPKKGQSFTQAHAKEKAILAEKRRYEVFPPVKAHKSIQELANLCGFVYSRGKIG
jgi:hypothetical protein